MLSQAQASDDYVFISYPHAGRKHGMYVADLLCREEIEVWIDDSIEPGTEDWELSVREAIENCTAVVVVCSPATARSQFVRAELELARRFRRPILPVWFQGKDWVDCVPFWMVGSLYIDCRTTKLVLGAQKLIDCVGTMLSGHANER